MAASSHVSRADFEAVFPSLVEDVSEAAKQYNIPTNALEWLQKVKQLEKLF
jgi:farnesyl diphosphate synthase